MSRPVSRALAGAGIVALVVAAPASALAAPHARGHATKPAPHARHVPPVRFTVVGTFTSIGTDSNGATITLAVKAGHVAKGRRSSPVTIDVPTRAAIVRNHARAKLSDFQVGDHVVVIGTLVRGTPDVYTASHVNGAGRRTPTPPSTPVTAPTPTDSPTATPTPTATDSPTATPTSTGTDSPTATSSPAAG